MAKYRLSLRSKQRLDGVHFDLVRVVKRAIEYTPIDFMVVEGVRTLERQKELYKAGATRTMNSRHLTGHAVDIAPMIGREVRWDWPLFYKLEPAMKRAARELGVPIEWGGEWRTFKDAPHWQLPFKQYPK